MSRFLPVVLLVVAGLLVRLPLLSSSFWLDEAAQALESSRPVSEQYKISADFQPPLFHYLVHFILQFSSSEAVTRSVSLISGLGAIVFLYFILRETAGENVARLAGLLLVVSPLHIFLSQELRPYALATGFACISWWAVLNLRARKHWFILATIGGFYSMYLFPLITLSQLIYYFFERKQQFRSLLILTLIAFLFFLPWLPFFFQQLEVGTNLARIWPGWSEVVSTPILKALPLTFAKLILGQAELKDSPFFLLLTFVSIVIVLLATLNVWKQKRYRFLVYWLLVPILAAWAISFIVPVIAPKRLLIVLPAMLGAVALFGAPAQRGRRIALSFIGFTFIFGTLLYWNVTRYQRENWRELITAIEQDAGNKKTVAVFAFPEPFAPWRWYQKKGIESVVTRTLRVGSLEELDSTLRRALEYERIYVFDYLTDLTDPQGYIKLWLANQGYQGVRSLDGGNVGFVRVFDSL